MRIRSGDLVDLIEFLSVDDSVRSWGSRTGGSAQPPFDLDHDEHIVRIVAQEGASLDGLAFHTSKGRESQWYGKRGGHPTEYKASADDPIVGIEREGGTFCPRITRVVRLSEARDVAPGSIASFV